MKFISVIATVLGLAVTLPRRTFRFVKRKFPRLRNLRKRIPPSSGANNTVLEAFRLILGREPAQGETTQIKIDTPADELEMYRSLLAGREFANRLTGAGSLPDDAEIGRRCRVLQGAAPGYSRESLTANFTANDIDVKHLENEFRPHLEHDDQEPFRDTLYFDNHAQRFRLLADLTLAIRRAPARVLEIGAAHLHLSTLLVMAGYSAAATDVADFVRHPRYARRARQFGIEHQILDLTRPDESSFGEGAFDIVMFSETLEHLNFSPLPAFAWMHRILKPGGAVIITTPNAYERRLLEDYVSLRATPFEDLERFISKPSFCLHHRLYTHGEIAALCGKAGLSVVMDSWQQLRGITGETLPAGEHPILIVAEKAR